jgi:CRISPR system Cascade subunit CasB
MTTTQTTRSEDARQLISRHYLKQLAGKIYADFTYRLTPGDVADLRRLDAAKDERPPAFWKLAVERLEPAGFSFADDDTPWDAPWAAAIAVMALANGIAGPRRALGAALAEANVAETRLLRLLRARDTALYDVLRTVARQLVSAAVAPDWADVAELTLSDRVAGERERVRREIARDYYRQLSMNNRSGGAL